MRKMEEKNKREEKRVIHVSKGMTICLIIIFILVIALMYVIITNQSTKGLIAEVENGAGSDVGVKEVTNSEINNESSFASNEKETSKAKNVFEVSDSIDNVAIRVEDGIAYIKMNKKANELANYGLETKNTKVNTNYQKINGFTSKVSNALIARDEHEYIQTTFVFLMEDGTVEYSELEYMLQNIKSQGKIEGLKDIVKIEKVNYSNDGWEDTSVIAIDKNNNKTDVFGIDTYVPEAEQVNTTSSLQSEIEKYIGEWYENEEWYLAAQKDSIPPECPSSITIKGVSDSKVLIDLYITRTIQLEDVEVTVNNNIGTWSVVTDQGPFKDGGDTGKIAGRIEFADNSIKLTITSSDLLYLDAARDINSENQFNYFEFNYKV